MSEATKAVFLSYARDDAAAARRIAEALRSAGLEVWFDENELRGGDTWDAKIRKQIDACTLFVPVISTHTQERSKGYFRLEWKLAVDQTHLLAEGVPFIAPVVIDDTREAQALVPPEFMRVQWSRLPGALPTPQFVEQVKRLLSKEQGAGSKEQGRGRSTEESPALRKAGLPGWTWSALTAVVVGVAVALSVSRKSEPAPVAAPVMVPPPASVLPSPAISPSADKSIAVLPFANMSSDKENEFFTDGIHEDILTNLAMLRDVRVLSRTSVMRYRGTTKSISEIARELNVAYILEGSVRRSGNKVRVTGQLIRAGSEEHLWARAYDRDLTDVFTIQGELATAIAGALQSVLTPEARDILGHRPTDNPAAYDLFLQARQMGKQGAMVDEEVIIGLLQQAVQLDANFAAAWALLGSRHAFAYFNRDRSAGRLAQAKTAIDTAMHLAADDPAVMEGLGDYYYYGYRDYARALEQYEKLVRLRPNDAAVYSSLAFIQRRQGRLPEALANFRHALQLDPESAAVASDLTNTLQVCRLYDEALSVGGGFLTKHPDNPYLAAVVAQVEYAAHGRVEALQAFARRPVSPENRPQQHYLRLAHARMLGDWSEAIRLDREERYFDGDTDTPRWMQDVLAAATLAESGDLAAARTRAAEAVNVMNAELARQPFSPLLWASLGLGHGLLGENDDAIRCATKAREILPESVDALQGRFTAGLSASALGWAGEKERALAEFTRLLHLPYGTSSMLDRGIYTGSWKPLRDDPRFKALLADPKNNQPLF